MSRAISGKFCFAWSYGGVFALVMIVGCVAACDKEDKKSNANTDPFIVELDDGIVQGDLAGQSRRFLAIPYAKPPLGGLRWKAPTPNDPWTGVRHQTEFVENCPQLADEGSPASNNEDCLYLNVWSPMPPPEKAPVMVWIHGGGNFSGGAGIPIPLTKQLWYDGQFFASRQGVVLVTIQYRLGPLGFFAHPALAKEGGPLGNQGLLDQRLALQWVQKNIAKFGGDPDNVTIFGESAGSADVCYHMISPGSRGLFHRAISESGGCTLRSVGAEQRAADIGDKMAAYGEAVGCPAGDGQLDCLRNASVEALLANSHQPAPGAGELISENGWSFAAVLDGNGGFLPDAPQTLFDRGEIADAPYLLGSNNDEGTTFVIRAAPLTTEAEYMDYLRASFGDTAEEIAAMYPPSDFGGDYNVARVHVVGDAMIICSTYDTALRAARAGRKVFMYNFNVPWSILPKLLLAGHASEISHVFGCPYLPNPDPASEAVGEAINTYWANLPETATRTERTRLRRGRNFPQIITSASNSTPAGKCSRTFVLESAPSGGNITARLRKFLLTVRDLGRLRRVNNMRVDCIYSVAIVRPAAVWAIAV